MIKKIIACSDIHIPSLKGIDDLKEQLKKFIDECKEIVENEGGPEYVRIAVAGDIFHNKISITNESILTVSWFLKELGNLCKTIIIIGNHDFLMNNMDRTDSLSPLFEIGTFDNVVYLDKETGFKSGCYIDDNVVWCLYSSFANFTTPDINEVKRLNPDKELTYVGIIHGDVNGATTALNHVSYNGLNPAVFDGCDFVIAGHIHKRQEILSDSGVRIVYCSSIVQQNIGETISGHGYVVWDISNNKKIKYVYKELKNKERGYYKFSINSIDDLDNDLEILMNY